ncbi:MAG TPA: type II toxin-antitoxin system VapC family toxin [Trueperaceae bacterium]|nr:type II toxin-antitoxin system VapC family toxin [Trueperaceae bacterium]
MKVLDASAMLAFLQGEPGSDVVTDALESGACCSAANWSEVAQKVRASGRNWELSRTLLKAYGLMVEPVIEVDAEKAAALWRAGSGMSLADRICLALAHRLQAPALTADVNWGSKSPVVQIR